MVAVAAALNLIQILQRRGIINKIIVAVSPLLISPPVRMTGKVRRALLKDHSPADGDLVAAKSVGTFVQPSSLVPVNGAIPTQGYHFRPTGWNLRKSVQVRVAMDNNVSKHKVLMDDYRFWDDDCLGDGTLFYLGDGVVATAGHVIEGSSEYAAKKPGEWLVVFGASEEYMGMQLATVNSAAVFVLEQ